jgi:hypothetical protein
MSDTQAVATVQQANPGEDVLGLAGRSNQQLVELYNEMYQTWTDLGGDNTFGTVRRFATADVGRARCSRLHQAIVARRGTEEVATVATVANGAPQGDAALGTPTTEETEDMARRKAAGRKPAREATRRRVSGNGHATIKELTEEYNSLVPAAKRAGITWARHHTSLFGSLAAGATQVQRLKKAISSAG